MEPPETAPAPALGLELFLEEPVEAAIVRDVFHENIDKKVDHERFLQRQVRALVEAADRGVYTSLEKALDLTNVLAVEDDRPQTTFFEDNIPLSRIFKMIDAMAPLSARPAASFVAPLEQLRSARRPREPREPRPPQIRQHQLYRTPRRHRRQPDSLQLALPVRQPAPPPPPAVASYDEYPDFFAAPAPSAGQPHPFTLPPLPHGAHSPRAPYPRLDAVQEGFPARRSGVTGSVAGGAGASGVSGVAGAAGATGAAGAGAGGGGGGLRRSGAKGTPRRSTVQFDPDEASLLAEAAHSLATVGQHQREGGGHGASASPRVVVSRRSRRMARTDDHLDELEEMRRKWIQTPATLPVARRELDAASFYDRSSAFLTLGTGGAPGRSPGAEDHDILRDERVRRLLEDEREVMQAAARIQARYKGVKSRSARDADDVS
jgi:hypothetical protein